nr:sodium ion-translocating decarboxylase subunit beta [Tenuifilaceae bacterium]
MEQSGGFFSFLIENLTQFLSYTGFANMTWGHGVMILIGLIFIYLAIKKEYEPLLLVPIGFGIIVGNIPFTPGFQTGIYESGSVLNYLYFGVIQGVYPPLIFLGIGA